MITRGLIVIAGLLVAIGSVAQPSVSANTEPVNVRVGESFTINLNISGDRIQKIVLPNVDGIRIATNPYGQSTSMSIVNGDTQTNVQLKYQAVAQEAGAYKLPPIEVTMSGEVYKTQPLELTVRKDNPRQPRTNQQSPSRPGDTDSAPEPGERTELTVDDLCFLTAEVDKRSAYQGEPIRLTFEFWRLDDRYFRLLSPQIDLRQQQVPAVGFYVQSIGNRQRRDTYKGHNFIVEEYEKVLFPTGVGDLTIGSWEYQAYAQLLFSGFRRHSYDLATEPITINVKPLPPRVDHFTGAVGQFEIAASVSDTDVVVGEPTDFVFSVMGEGNPEAIGAPPAPEVENAYVDDAESTVQPTPSHGDLAIEKQFLYSIVPNVPGTLEIPAIDFAYFDPANEKYVTKRTKAFEVQVAAAPEGQQRIVVDSGGGGPEQNTSVEVIERDLRAIARNPGPIRPVNRSNWLLFLGLSAPPLAYAGFAFAIRRQRRFASDTRLARSHFARSRSRKRLAEAAQAEDPSEALYRALAGFIADKFNVPEGGMTSHDAEALFHEKGIEPDLAESMVKTMRACERARYGSAKLSEQEINALMDATEHSMERLEAALGKRGGR